MRRVLAILAVMLLGTVPSSSPGMAGPQEVRAVPAPAPSPAYLRTGLTICGANTVPCTQPLFGPEISLSRARAAWVLVTIYARPLTPGGPNPLDQAPHTLRLVVAKSLYQTDAPLQLERWWRGTIRGRRSWKLSSLATLPARAGQPNYFQVLVSVDGWPTPAQQTIAIPL
jgi:hypothetical protein